MKRLLFIGLRNVHVYIGTLYVVSLLHLTNHIYICQSLPPSLFLSQCLTPTYLSTNLSIFQHFSLSPFPSFNLSPYPPSLPINPSTYLPVSTSHSPPSPYHVPRPTEVDVGDHGRVRHTIEQTRQSTRPCVGVRSVAVLAGTGTAQVTIKPLFGEKIRGRRLVKVGIWEGMETEREG